MVLPSRAGPEVASGLAHPYVIVVASSRVLAAGLADVCRGRGLPVRIAQDVPSALRQICAEPPAAVLTALDLPGLPGTSLVAALKSAPQFQAIPAVLITATGTQIPAASCRPDLILPQDDELPTALDRSLDTLAAATYAASPRTRCGGRVLLADDTVSLRKLVSRWLQAAGVEVTAVENGVEAVRIAAAATFDLILMDVEMPELDGWAATRLIRTRGIQTPVIAFTAHEGDGVRQLAAAAGCTDVLPKPVSRAALLRAYALHSGKALVGA